MIRGQMAQFGRTDVSEQELNDISERILGNQDEGNVFDQLMSKKMIDLFRAEANPKNKKVSYEDFVKQAKIINCLYLNHKKYNGPRERV